MDMNMHVNVK